MCVIFNWATAQPFIKVKPVIALDLPLSTACQNSSPAIVENGAVFHRLFSFPFRKGFKDLSWSIGLPEKTAVVIHTSGESS